MRRPGRLVEGGADVMIHKHSIHSVNEMVTIIMPYGARILHAADQDGRLVVWAMVDPPQVPQRRRLVLLGTGFDVPPKCDYVNTFQSGEFVWHLFVEYTA